MERERWVCDFCGTRGRTETGQPSETVLCPLWRARDEGGWVTVPYAEVRVVAQQVVPARAERLEHLGDGGVSCSSSTRPAR